MLSTLCSYGAFYSCHVTIRQTVGSRKELNFIWLVKCGLVVKLELVWFLSH